MLVEVGLEQLLGRDVDINLDVLGPPARLLAGLAQHPLADRDDQPRVLGERDELAGADEAVVGTVPTHQRLEAHHRLAARVDHRLVVERQLLAPERLAQRDLELTALLGRGVQQRLEAAMLAAARVLGLVEREVRIAHQLLDRGAVLRAEGRPDAGADIERVLLDLIGGREVLDDAAGEFAHRAARADIAHHDGEFVAAEPAAHLAFAHQRLKPRGNLREQLVAGEMTERIIDRLEAVEIDHQQRALAAPLAGIEQGLAQRLGDLKAVGQRGKSVVACEIGDLFGGLALFGHVRTHTAESLELAVLADHRRARQLPPPLLAEDRDLHEQVREMLARTQPLDQIAQARRVARVLPAGRPDQIEQRLAIRFGLAAPERKGEARADRPHPARGIEFPQPVGLVLLELAQQHGDHRFLFDSGCLGQTSLEIDPSDLDRPHDRRYREQHSAERRFGPPLQGEMQAGAEPERNDESQNADRHGRKHEDRTGH